MTDHNSEQRRDFFISYNKGDRNYAEWIAWILEEASYSVFIQAWDFRAGQNFVLKMQEAATMADRTIAVLSQNFLDSRFTQPEWAAAFAQDPTGEGRKLILIRVGDCELTGLLAQSIYIDLLGLEEAAAQVKILTELQARGKPDQKPSFPTINEQAAPERVTSGRVAFPAVTIVGQQNNIDKQVNIRQDGEGNTQIFNFNDRLPQLEGDPFVPPAPRQDQLFGRDSDLARLHELLQAGKNVCVVAGSNSKFKR